METETASARGRGSDAYREAFLKGLRPEPRITVSEWADRHRLLTKRSSQDAGPWRTSRTPYLREIMDALSSTSTVQLLVFMKGSQIGGTEVANNWIGYTIHHQPGPFMLVMPTETVQKRKSRQTLDALIEDTPVIAERVVTRKKDPGNTTLMKVFPGGMLVLASANSSADLRSMAARCLALDELDAYPDELTDEGDPEELAERATMSFGRTRKIFKVSTPTSKGRSRIERAFGETDRRFYHVPCPRCDHFQRITWARIKWDHTDDEPTETVIAELSERRRTAWMECEECKARIDEHEKPGMLERGVWIPENPKLGERVRGYHLSALYAPLGMYSWTSSVIRFLRARGRPQKLRVWINEDLGETFKEPGEAPEWRKLYELRERYPMGQVPRRAVLLTAGVDVQKDRIEYEVIAWGPGMEHWSIEYVVHPCDPTKPDGLAEVDRLLRREFPVRGAGPEDELRSMRLAGLAIDTGYEAQKIYKWARKYGRSARLYLIKGRTGGYGAIGVPVWVDVDMGGRKLKRGARVWPIDTGVLKEDVYDSLELRPPVDPEEPFPEGYCHFPQYGPEYFKGLTSEVLKRRRIKSGRTVLDWEVIYERNEPLDCRVYGRAALEILGGSRWSREDWNQLRAMIQNLPPIEPAPPPTPPSPQEPPQPPRDSPWQRFRRRT